MSVRSLFPILLTRELPELVGFYERALGGVVAYRFPDEHGADAYVGLQVDGASLGIGRDENAAPPGAGERVALWFYVDDVDSAYAAWVSAGGHPIEPPADMPWGERVARVRDPDGNLVNLGAEVSADES